MIYTQSKYRGHKSSSKIHITAICLELITIATKLHIILTSMVLYILGQTGVFSCICENEIQQKGHDMASPDAQLPCYFVLGVGLVVNS